MEVTFSHKNDRKIRVLYVITKANWGGAQRYVFDLASAARDAGHEVAVAYGSPGRLADRLATQRITTYPISGLGRDVGFRDVAVFFSLVRLMRRFKPDVVHLNSSKIGGLGSLAARCAGVSRVIFTAHGWAFNENRTRIEKIVIKILYFVTIVLASKTITVSERMRRQVRRFPFVQRKILVIHNGVAQQPLYSREEARAFVRGLSKTLDARLANSETMVIGTNAELHHIKGIEYLIEAALTLILRKKDFVVLVMGEGEERAELQKMVREKKLEETVFFLGHIADAARYLNAYDIFVLPSLSEGLAYAILEAGSAGLPVVASHVGGIPEIIEDGRDGLLVPPKNSQELAEELLSLMSDAARRRRLGSALKERVARNFSFEGMIEKTLALYRS